MDKNQNVLNVVRTAVAEFDPGGTAGLRTIAAHGLGVYIPDNAIIIGGGIDVIETLTSNAATDGATLALHVQGAGDLVAALAISDGSDIWDAGVHGILPGNFALDGNSLTAIAMAAKQKTSWIKTTAVRELTITIAVEALDTSAGKLFAWVDYVVTE